MGIRSGRFTSDDATAGVKIIDGRTGAFYRILNSGGNPFRVDAGGSTTTTVKGKFSLDVVVSNRVIIDTTTAVRIEGMYEYLATDRSIRSGRFKTNELTAADRHKIIDLAVGGGAKKPSAFYRIFNSGSKDFDVRAGTALLQMIKPEQSFDFEIRGATGAHRDIYVNPTADNDLIEGIYDFLGMS